MLSENKIKDYVQDITYNFKFSNKKELVIKFFYLIILR
jgi:hypothetical protein